MTTHNFTDPPADEFVRDREPIGEYKVTVRLDGSFAAHCVHTGRIVAGYDRGRPALSIEAAAAVITASKGGVYRLRVRGTLPELIDLLHTEYRQCIRKLPKDHREQEPFPAGRVYLE